MEEFKERLQFAEDLFFKDEARTIYLKQYKSIEYKDIHTSLAELDALIGTRVTIAEEKKRLDELRSILAEMRTLIEGVEQNDSTIKYRFSLLRRYIKEESEYAYKRQDDCIIKAREFCLEFVKNRLPRNS